MISFTHLIKISFFAIMMVCISGHLNSQSDTFYDTRSFTNFENEVFSIPDNFNLRLNHLRLDQFNRFQSNQKSPAEILYFPETVTVYSVNDEAKQYTYLYSAAGDRLNTTIKKYINEMWVNSSFETCTYDEIGNRLTSIWKIWVNGAYVNLSKTTWTYTTNRNVLTELKQNWSGNTWVNDEKTSNSYDVVGNRVATLKEKWLVGAWSNDLFELLTYNSSNKLVDLTRQIWSNNSWINSLKLIYSYDPNLNLSTGIIQNWSGSEWVNTYNEIYAYNNSNQLTMYFGQVWDGIWKFSEKYTYTYNSLGFRVSGLGENYLNNGWVNNIRAQYNHNSYGGIQSELTESWGSGEWVKETLKDNTYDEAGNALICNVFYWDDSNWVQNQDGELILFFSNSNFTQFYTGYRANSTYTSVLVGQHDVKSPMLDLTISPNPVNDYLNINLNLEESSGFQVAVYSLAGQKILENNYEFNVIGPQCIKLPVHDLTNGIYILKIIYGGLDYKYKIMISK